MKKDARIYIAGHRGLVGSNLVDYFREKGHTNLLTADRSELDLENQAEVNRFFKDQKPEHVIVAAAKVGGIYANMTYRTEFMYSNLMIGANVIRAAADNGTEKLLFLGSSCIYPKMAPQPIKEESLLSSSLEKTNEAYALAKIACLKLCEYYFRDLGRRFISAMPTNLYGPGDNYHPENSHVIPGMMRRFHEAKMAGAESVAIWGTGQARREFLYVKDLVDALYRLMQDYERPETINVGTGQDLTIMELAQTMKDVVGFEGEITLDPSKPDGTPRKVLDVSRMTELGWKPSYTLRDGLKASYEWALEQKLF